MFDVDYCIVGAGPSGLTAAYRLLQSGKRILMVERDERAGGLAKSHTYAGGHIFDTGPKRFHTDDPIVKDFINEILGNRIASIGRSTQVYFQGKYFNWPLSNVDLFKLPLPFAVRCLGDLLARPVVNDKASFREYIQYKYGNTIYNEFFKPYTEKFLCWDSADIHSDWASTGINRSIIDKRFNAHDLTKIISAFLLPQQIHTQFLYPSQGGFGGFYGQLLDTCRSLGGFELLLNDTVLGIKALDAGLQLQLRSGRSVSCADLIWTGNLNDLLAILGQGQRVHYLNTVFYNLVCHQDRVRKKGAQWIYISRGDISISRVTFMREFSPYLVPKGYYNLICELTDNQASPRYMAQPRAYVQNILDELKQIGIIESPAAVQEVHVNAVKDTYPIYHRHYLRDFGMASAAVRKFSRRIHLLGRSGAFWYNNSDHSIRFALEMVKRLLTDDPREYNYRGYFGPSAMPMHKGKA